MPGNYFKSLDRLCPKIRRSSVMKKSVELKNSKSSSVYFRIKNSPLHAAIRDKRAFLPDHTGLFSAIWSFPNQVYCHSIGNGTLLSLERYWRGKWCKWKLFPLNTQSLAIHCNIFRSYGDFQRGECRFRILTQNIDLRFARQYADKKHFRFAILFGPFFDTICAGGQFKSDLQEFGLSSRRWFALPPPSLLPSFSLPFYFWRDSSNNNI